MDNRKVFSLRKNVIGWDSVPKFITLIVSLSALIVTQQTHAEALIQVKIPPSSTASKLQSAAAQPEEIRVIGTAPSRGALATDQLPYAVQSFAVDQLSVASYYSAVDLLDDRAVSVSTNAAQNNRLQPDLQYRGFTASPLLGLSQGLAVYQNGVRINEVFGDTVNWDLLTANSMDRLDLIGGANAVYGLNAIGGAITVRTKTGFANRGGEVSYSRGQYDSEDYSLSVGDHGQQWGYFLAIDGMSEDGWRDFSASRANSLYGALSWRSSKTDADLFVNYGDSNLRGNGSVPVDLLAIDRNAVFTHPDITENTLTMVSTSVRHSLSAETELNVTAFYRDLNTQTFNGDGAEYEECFNEDADPSLSTEDDASLEGWLCDDDGVPAEDTEGQWVSEDFNAVNNRSQRDQQSYGVTLQALMNRTAFGREHQMTLGLDYFRGETRFGSTVEYASLSDDRGTIASDRYDAEGFTDLNAELETWSLFASDQVTLTPRLGMTLSARFNDTQITSWDPSGMRPELAGDHGYHNLNGGLGLRYDAGPTWMIYGNIQTSTRTPTPVELACSHPEAPCSLPNSFLADPPLDDVRAVSAEIGIRGDFDGLNYGVGMFVVRTNDDILFQTVGGVSSNQGFFQNAADTQRAGIELSFSGEYSVFDWYLNYSYLQATYESGFISSSANNPAAVDGQLMVGAGSDIPGLPDHNLKLGGDFDLTENWQLGADLRFADGQHLRGDEANVDAKTDSYWVADVYTRANIGQSLFVEARIENVFDAKYETFGLYGEADEVLTDIDNESGRFLGPAAPRTAWLTVGCRW